MRLFSIFILLLGISFFPLTAQIPSSCFEIERVLVDACSSPEGQNEMVFFRVGQVALNTSNLTVQWPNNSWKGVCQDAGTAAKIDSMNTSILSCGRLLEPTGSILPAGSRVILISSTNAQAFANSFANLTDTLYVIFQCAGNTSGHFANFNATPSSRSVTLAFSSPAPCYDGVTYDVSKLININGATGGTTTERDGASVAFLWDGSASYYNNGCQAPFIPSFISAGKDTSVCQSGAVKLTGSANAVSGLIWSSTQGTFDTSNILTPLFNPNTNAVPPYIIILTGSNSCETLHDTVLVNIASEINVTLTLDNPIICGSDSAEICAPKSYGAYLWNTGETSACIKTNKAGNYSVDIQDQNGCAITAAPVSVGVYPSPSVSIIRQGDTLSSFGAVTYQWMRNQQPITGATSAVYVARESGLYSLKITDANGCEAVSTGIEITVTGIPNIWENAKIFVYPNPAYQDFHFNITGVIHEHLVLMLYDALGQLVEKEVLSKGQNRISRKNLSHGLYFWQVSSGSEILARGKLDLQ